ncbi:MAG: glycosyl hydrolase 115 family protein [Planctomycetota bacterium]|nr:glycosyl hydrolase 115 family protein [Planctomycetota bacterium]
MFQLHRTTTPPTIYVAPDEPDFIVRAIDDLRRDCERVLGLLPTLSRELPAPDAAGAIVVATVAGAAAEWCQQAGLTRAAGLAKRPEAHAISTFGTEHGSLAILGSDVHGTLFGIYTVCEECLGVDPWQAWTDVPVAERDCWAMSPGWREQAPAVRWRGWFLNDEDLLTEWIDGPGRRDLDYPFYSKVVSDQALAQSLETALRLRCNLIIPASFVDIMNPAERHLLDLAHDRGFYISQHHIEPLGLSMFAFETWSKRQGVERSASYASDPEPLREAWRAYAKEWSRYDRVIWQLGLRGRGDRPVWVHDPNTPQGSAERGALISQAMADQHAIVTELMGDKPALFTTTMWMEGNQLNAGGHLSIPEGVIRILSDQGHTQYWGEDFTRDRDPTAQYGVYFHVAFWGYGPHLVQGTTPAKIVTALGEAIDSGASEYVILNVCNQREMATGIDAVARICWRGQADSGRRLLADWVGRSYAASGADNAAITEAYEMLYAAFPVMRDQHIPGVQVALDGWVRSTGLDMIHGKAAKHDPAMVTKLGTLGSARFDAVGAYAAALAAHLPPPQAAYLRAQIQVQAAIMAGCNRWLVALTAATQARANGEEDAAQAAFETGIAALEATIAARAPAEQGRWQQWYRGDRKYGLSQMLAATRNAATAVSCA